MNAMNFALILNLTSEGNDPDEILHSVVLSKIDLPCPEVITVLGARASADIEAVQQAFSAMRGSIAHLDRTMLQVFFLFDGQYASVADLLHAQDCVRRALPDIVQIRTVLIWFLDDEKRGDDRYLPQLRQVLLPQEEGGNLAKGQVFSSTFLLSNMNARAENTESKRFQAAGVLLALMICGGLAAPGSGIFSLGYARLGISEGERRVLLRHAMAEQVRARRILLDQEIPVHADLLRCFSPEVNGVAALHAYLIRLVQAQLPAPDQLCLPQLTDGSSCETYARGVYAKNAEEHMAGTALRAAVNVFEANVMQQAHGRVVLDAVLQFFQQGGDFSRLLEEVQLTRNGRTAWRQKAIRVKALWMPENRKLQDLYNALEQEYQRHATELLTRAMEMLHETGRELYEKLQALQAEQAGYLGRCMLDQRTLNWYHSAAPGLYEKMLGELARVQSERNGNPMCRIPPDLQLYDEQGKCLPSAWDQLFGCIETAMQDAGQAVNGWIAVLEGQENSIEVRKHILNQLETGLLDPMLTRWLYAGEAATDRHFLVSDRLYQKLRYQGGLGSAERETEYLSHYDGIEAISMFMIRKNFTAADLPMGDARQKRERNQVDEPDAVPRVSQAEQDAPPLPGKITADHTKAQEEQADAQWKMRVEHRLFQGRTQYRLHLIWPMQSALMAIEVQVRSMGADASQKANFAVSKGSLSVTGGAVDITSAIYQGKYHISLHGAEQLLCEEEFLGPREEVEYRRTRKGTRKVQAGEGDFLLRRQCFTLLNPIEEVLTHACIRYEIGEQAVLVPLPPPRERHGAVEWTLYIPEDNYVELCVDQEVADAYAFVEI